LPLLKFQPSYNFAVALCGYNTWSLMSERAVVMLGLRGAK